jgi:hypothetical protein
MTILEYAEIVGLKQKNETEKAKLLCYYHQKETGETLYSMQQIAKLFGDFGFSVPNSSRLKDKLINGKEKAFKQDKSTSDLEFIPIIFQNMDKEYTKYWNDIETVDSNSELIDEVKFCGKRGYLTKLIRQINCSYKLNCYDACAVLLRRLFEILLILSYQALGIDSEIKNSDSSYFMLEGIVKNAVSNTILNISKRQSDNYDLFRRIGNFSAHGLTYNAGKKDIDDIKLAYRVMLEDLYNKAGLL